MTSKRETSPRPESSPRQSLVRAWSVLESVAAEENAQTLVEAQAIIERDRAQGVLSSGELELLPFASELARAERLLSFERQELLRAVFAAADDALRRKE